MNFKIICIASIGFISFLSAAAAQDSTQTRTDYCVDGERAILTLVNNGKFREKYQRKMQQDTETLLQSMEMKRNRLNEIQQKAASGQRVSPEEISEAQSIETELATAERKILEIEKKYQWQLDSDVRRLEAAVRYETDLMSKEQNRLIHFGCDFSSPNKVDLTDEIIPRASKRFGQCLPNLNDQTKIECDD